jgi:exodeoxyribonuclease VII large subunit
METIKLSSLLGQIQETLEDHFYNKTFWVSAQITNVKKYESSRRCYLTLEDYEGGQKTADIKAVFWANYYSEIERFEKITKQTFSNGIEIICRVKVKFHAVYGLSAEVIQIDLAHTLGTLELERQKTLELLLKENPKHIQLFDGVYKTFNNRLPLPLIIKNIALITAPNSDGQRDFLQEIAKNKHAYSYNVTEFLTTIQGDNAHVLILEQLALIAESNIQFDVVAIVRGGGSQTDFKPFDQYELAKTVALFKIPVFTGIGHDRNQSIIDLMAREQKTPTKVASLFVEHNFEFENRLIDLKNNLTNLVSDQLLKAKNNLEQAKRIVKLASPQAILNRGFAIITSNNKIVTNPVDIAENAELKTVLRDSFIYSTVTKKVKNEKDIIV